MKQGTIYARKLKKAYTKIRQAGADPVIPEADEPLYRLGIAVFGVKYGQAVARSGIDRLLSVFSDWNEVRVSTPAEINGAMDETGKDRLEHCRRLVDALTSVFDHENRMSLDRLKQLGLREARQYLEELQGVDEYAVASVSLWSLGGHGIPVDDRLLQELRQANLVHPDASRGEVQAFLERHISVAEAQAFCIVMDTFESAEPARAAHGKNGTAKKSFAKKKKKKST